MCVQCVWSLQQSVSHLRKVAEPRMSSRSSSDWFTPRVYPPVPPPTGSRPRYILPFLLRLVHAPGISSRSSSDWFTPRVYPLVPPRTGSRPGYILSFLLGLVHAPGISSRSSSDWFLPGVARRRRPRLECDRMPTDRVYQGWRVACQRLDFSSGSRFKEPIGGGTGGYTRGGNQSEEERKDIP
eukprot:1187167-Prorocentrum_minimum.AAC.1